MPAEIPDAAQLHAAHTHAADRAAGQGPAGPPPAGRIVYLPPGADHTCNPPVRPVLRFAIITFGGERPTEPDAPDGAVWRCTCGRSWTAAAVRNTRTWRPATWTERLKARLLSHRGPASITDSPIAPVTTGPAGG